MGILLRDLERCALVVAAGACLGVGALVLLVAVLVAVVGASLSTFTSGLPGLGVLAGPSDPSARAVGEIPRDQLAVMRQVAASSSCHLPWTVLAGVAGVESAFGRNMGPSSAGATGYGQFLPGTWALYGQGGNPDDYHDALPAMARYLCALGAGTNLEQALWS
jgi:hypothetical protein